MGRLFYCWAKSQPSSEFRDSLRPVKPTVVTQFLSPWLRAGTTYLPGTTCSEGRIVQAGITTFYFPMLFTSEVQGKFLKDFSIYTVGSEVFESDANKEESREERDRHELPGI